MKWDKILLFMAVVATGDRVLAQEGTVLKDAGLLKLKVFLGTWEGRNIPESADSSWAVYSCRWSDNGHFLVCDQMVRQKAVASNNLSIYSYDGTQDSYTLSLVGIPGSDPFTIPVRSRGDTLFYTGQYKDQGRTVYTRTLNVFATKERYRFMTQTSDDSVHWTTISGGLAVKTAPARP
jgi:hypothetical protein